jgi:hypothetical protein
MSFSLFRFFYFFFCFIFSFQILFNKVEDAGEDVVNSEENDIDPGLLNTVLNISPEVSKNVPHISGLV